MSDASDHILDDDLDRLMQALSNRLENGEAFDFSEISAKLGIPQEIVEDCARSFTAIKSLSRNSQTLIPGMTIENYLILEVLGHGAMGQVFLVREKQERKNYALKLLAGVSKKASVEYKRFQKEAEILLQFDHPHIVKVKKWGHFHKQPYVVMDLVLGGDLNKFLASRPQIDIPEVLKLATSLAEAIAYTHSKNILHRDIKPHNLLVEDGQLKLTDFGLAKRLKADGTQHTRIGQFLGTLGYVSPEQAKGDLESVDQRSDIYSFGATLYHMLVGKPPFFDEFMKTERNNQIYKQILVILQQEPEPLSSLRPELNAEPYLTAICLRCLKKEPSKRYQSAQRLLKDLKRATRWRPMINWAPFRLFF